MTFRVTILGSSSALPTVSKYPSAHALNVHEQFFLIDCGEGTQQQLLRYGISPMKINAVFITHLHGDHVFGIFGLISTLGLLGRRTPLQIFAPRPFDEILACMLKYFTTNLPYEVQWKEVETRKHQMLYENKVLEVWSIPLRHRIPCAGFLFREKTPPLNVRKEAIEKYGLSIAQIVTAKRGEDIALTTGEIIPNERITYIPYKGRSYAYCSDTLYSARVAELVLGTDLFYHEATFLHTDLKLAKETGHTTALQAGRLAAKAGVGKLVIGHFSARYKEVEALVEEARTEFPETVAAVEGADFDIPLALPR